MSVDSTDVRECVNRRCPANGRETSQPTCQSCGHPTVPPAKAAREGRRWRIITVACRVVAALGVVALAFGVFRLATADDPISCGQSSCSFKIPDSNAVIEVRGFSDRDTFYNEVLNEAGKRQVDAELARQRRPAYVALGAGGVLVVVAVILPLLWQRRPRLAPRGSTPSPPSPSL